MLKLIRWVREEVRELVELWRMIGEVQRSLAGLHNDDKDLW